MTPYTTSAGVRIGAAYTPPPARMSDDAAALQAALLERERIERFERKGHAAAIYVGAAILAVLSLLLITGRF